MNLYRISFDSTIMFGWFENHQDVKDTLENDIKSPFVLNDGDNNLYHYWSESCREKVFIEAVKPKSGIFHVEQH